MYCFYFIYICVCLFSGQRKDMASPETPVRIDDDASPTFEAVANTPSPTPVFNHLDTSLEQNVSDSRAIAADDSSTLDPHHKGGTTVYHEEEEEVVAEEDDTNDATDVSALTDRTSPTTRDAGSVDPTDPLNQTAVSPQFHDVGAVTPTPAMAHASGSLGRDESSVAAVTDGSAVDSAHKTEYGSKHGKDVDPRFAPTPAFSPWQPWSPSRDVEECEMQLYDTAPTWEDECVSGDEYFSSVSFDEEEIVRVLAPTPLYHQDPNLSHFTVVSAASSSPGDINFHDRSLELTFHTLRSPSTQSSGGQHHHHHHHHLHSADAMSDGANSSLLSGISTGLVVGTPSRQPVERPPLSPETTPSSVPRRSQHPSHKSGRGGRGVAAQPNDVAALPPSMVVSSPGASPPPSAPQGARVLAPPKRGKARESTGAEEVRRKLPLWESPTSKGGKRTTTKRPAPPRLPDPHFGEYCQSTRQSSTTTSVDGRVTVGSTVHDRLFQQGSALITKRRTHDEKLHRQSQEINEQIEDLTFRPQLREGTEELAMRSESRRHLSVFDLPRSTSVRSSSGAPPSVSLAPTASLSEEHDEGEPMGRLSTRLSSRRSVSAAPGRTTSVSSLSVYRASSALAEEYSKRLSFRPELPEGTEELAVRSESRRHLRFDKEEEERLRQEAAEKRKKKKFHDRYQKLHYDPHPHALGRTKVEDDEVLRRLTRSKSRPVQQQQRLSPKNLPTFQPTISEFAQNYVGSRVPLHLRPTTTTTPRCAHDYKPHVDPLDDVSAMVSPGKTRKTKKIHVESSGYGVVKPKAIRPAARPPPSADEFSQPPQSARSSSAAAAARAGPLRGTEAEHRVVREAIRRKQQEVLSLQRRAPEQEGGSTRSASETRSASLGVVIAASEGTAPTTTTARQVTQPHTTSSRSRRVIPCLAPLSNALNGRRYYAPGHPKHVPNTTVTKPKPGHPVLATPRDQQPADHPFKLLAEASNAAGSTKGQTSVAASTTAVETMMIQQKEARDEAAAAAIEKAERIKDKRKERNAAPRRSGGGTSSSPKRLSGKTAAGPTRDSSKSKRKSQGVVEQTSSPQRPTSRALFSGEGSNISPLSPWETVDRNTDAEEGGGGFPSLSPLDNEGRESHHQPGGLRHSEEQGVLSSASSGTASPSTPQFVPISDPRNEEEEEGFTSCKVNPGEASANSQQPDVSNVENPAENVTATTTSTSQQATSPVIPGSGAAAVGTGDVQQQSQSGKKKRLFEWAITSDSDSD